MTKEAKPDHPIHGLIAKRWSPYGFSTNPVAADDLRSLLEAARWAASSYNEQPWSFIIATKEQSAEYQRVLSCLVEANQQWAKAAPVLGLTVASLRFSRNDKPNRVAVHDIGLAMGNLTFEATARGLCVHQMAGIDQERIRSEFNVPEHHAPWTGFAIGYAADADTLPEALKERDTSPRPRKLLSEFVFTGAWGQPSPAVT